MENVECSVVAIVGYISLYMQKMELCYEWEYSNDKTRINWLNETVVIKTV